MIGLFLQGGGAKGAFEAGAIEALYKSDIIPGIVSATSIGAINSYFLLTGNVDKLSEFWNNIEDIDFREPQSGEKVIDNTAIMDYLRALEVKESPIEDLYINYVEVENSELIELIVNIGNCDRNEALRAIKYSSLLPFIEESSRDTKEIMEKFKRKLSLGEYDGYYLDGGIVNNNFTEPLEKNKIDEVYLIVLSNNYKVKEAIRERYGEDSITIIRPEFKLDSTDTLNFDGEFCRSLYKSGYETAKRILGDKVKRVLK